MVRIESGRQYSERARADLASMGALVAYSGSGQCLRRRFRGPHHRLTQFPWKRLPALSREVMFSARILISLSSVSAGNGDVSRPSYTIRPPSTRNAPTRAALARWPACGGQLRGPTQQLSVREELRADVARVVAVQETVRGADRGKRTGPGCTLDWQPGSSAF